jgi:hypothetical protein
VIDVIEFRDQSGRLEYFKNFADIYHVYVYNSLSKCVFSGFVDWAFTDALLEEIEYIRWEFGQL